MRSASRDVGRALVNAFRAIEAANPKRLAGIFGNASWTDKAQMPDETLKNLIEHFSQHDLGLTAVPEDELGNAYEYLIKQFADDSGHTAQEFYTNRTLVHLMTQMLEPQPGERIYDPTVGTGGMLISSLAEVKRRGGDTRTLGLFGQELIHITASIARMNLVLHGVEDFEIVAGNTLSNPALHRPRPAPHVRRGPRQSAVLDQEVEPRGVAERSVGPQLPRHAAAGPRRLRLLPAHSEEPRSEDRPLRHPVPARRAVPQRRGGDAAQAGGSSTSSSASSASARISSTTPRWKPASSSAARGSRRSVSGRILFIDAVHEVARERAQSFLKPEHQQRILAAYRAFADEPGFAKVVDDRGGARERTRTSRFRATSGRCAATRGRWRRTISTTAWAAFDASGREFWQEMDELVEMLDSVGG